MVTWLVVAPLFLLFDLWSFFASCRLHKLDIEGTAVTVSKCPNFIIKRPRI